MRYNIKGTRKKGCLGFEDSDNTEKLIRKEVKRIWIWIKDKLQ